MQLPELLQQAIEEEMAHRSLQAISEASSHLSDRYKKGISSDRFILSEYDRFAYILSRMPATFSAIFHVLKELQYRTPDFHPGSFLDLGAGPGTGLWASSVLFSSIHQFEAWEYDEKFMTLGKKLARENMRLSQVQWKLRNFAIDRDLPLSDLVLLSYSIGEIEEKFWGPFLHEVWDKVQSTLVIIEPGTPAGYARILKIRDQLIQQGALLIAPCPHMGNCPLKGPDWCHFFARVERSSLHRKVKNAVLNYEDEKFSYLIFSKEPKVQSFSSRLLRHPQIFKGHLKLSLCRQDGQIQEQVVSKKDNSFYKLSRKLDWGDCF